MAVWTPAELTELLKALFYGTAILCGPLATAYTIIAASRTKRSEEASLKNAKSIEVVNANVKQLEKNTNSISERNEAIARKLGLTEGVAQERASVLAHAAPGPVPGLSALPLPVADERTATASERSADAAERVADAAEEAIKPVRR